MDRGYTQIDIRINPMDLGGKKNADVVNYRHFLVEFDRGKNGKPIPKEKTGEEAAASSLRYSCFLE